MKGSEIIEVCKTREKCDGCPVYQECKKWKNDMLNIEPWEMGKVIDEKEY